MIYTTNATKKATLRLLPNLMKDGSKVGESVFLHKGKYYSYCLVLEDEQNPELIGKIVILQYDLNIKRKIISELNVRCNVFDIFEGKNLILNHDSISFDNISLLPIFIDGKLEKLSAENNSFDEVTKKKVIEFLLNREYELESVI